MADNEVHLVIDSTTVHICVRNGRIFVGTGVTLGYPDSWLTPGAARWIATFLIHAANDAERIGSGGLERVATAHATTEADCNCGMGGQLHESTCPRWAPIISERFDPFAPPFGARD